VRSIEPLMVEVQKQRRLVMSGLQASVDTAAIDSRLAEVRTALTQVTEGRELAAALEGVIKRGDAVKAAVAAGATADMLAAPMQALVDTLTAMRTSVLDISNLSLDPEQASYYLMTVSVDQASSVIEAISRGRAVAGAMEHRQAAKPRELQELYAIWATGRDKLEGLADQLDRAAAAEPEIKHRVDLSLVLSTNQAYLKAAEAAWFGDAFKADVTGLNAPGQAAIDALRSFSSSGAQMLDELLQRRIDNAARERNEVIAGVAMCLVLVSYLFYSFYIVMRGGLGEVARHLRAMTEGDLTTTPRPWGRDEAAGLMLSLAEMQHALRSIVAEVRGASDQLVHASAEIASASQDLSTRSEQAAANLEESASAIEEISSTVSLTAERAQDAARLAAVNAEAADASGTTIGSVVETMQRVQDSSSKISEIIGVIDGIAFQTNILALNAAVEAARAGEQGRGFAVVASEVRALAHRSASAAKEIKGLIGSSVEHVKAGGEVVGDAGRTIRELVATADRMKTLLNEVSTGAAEQSLGVGQIDESIAAGELAGRLNGNLGPEPALNLGLAYMLKGRGDNNGVMKASPELLRVVRFARVNLHADSYPIQGFFDLILCRNVLIYFDQKSKEKVISGIVRHLSPSGLLFVGHSENLGGISPNLRTVAPTVYAPMPSADNPSRKIAH